MTILDWAQIFACSSVVFVGLGSDFNGNRGMIGSILSLIADKPLWRGLRKDLYDPKIVAGGMLGLILKMFKLGLLFGVISGLLWGISLL